MAIFKINNTQKPNVVGDEVMVSLNFARLETLSTSFGVLLLVALLFAQIFPTPFESLRAGDSTSVRNSGMYVPSPPQIATSKLSVRGAVLGRPARDPRSYVDFIAQVVQRTSRRLNSADAFTIARTIVNESQVSGMDPLFVAAVVKAESTFNKAAISLRGARGLMQLMPSTGEYISTKKSIDWEGEGRLHEPEYNLRLGVAYLKYLNQAFDGDRERVLMAYNWGPNNLRTALRSGGKAPSTTQRYARTIIETHAKWLGEFEMRLAESQIPIPNSLLG